MLSFFPKKWRQTQNWLKARVLQARHSLFNRKILKNPICTILCVDDDRSFCLFMQKLAHSRGIQLDAVYSIQEAKKAIERNPTYQAFIIDGHLPDGAGFGLVAWIRVDKQLTVPIGFLSRIYRDAKSFRILKEHLHVNYVLDKPLLPSEVHQLFVQICHEVSSSQAVGQEPFSDALLADLKMDYQKTIADKIERLEQMILHAQKNPSLENLQLLKREVHKIAGSAGSYGYMAVSDLCKNLEFDLNKQIDLVKRGQFNPQWLSLLDDFFTQIKLNFQI